MWDNKNSIWTASFFDKALTRMMFSKRFGLDEIPRSTVFDKCHISWGDSFSYTPRIRRQIWQGRRYLWRIIGPICYSKSQRCNPWSSKATLLAACHQEVSSPDASLVIVSPPWTPSGSCLFVVAPPTSKTPFVCSTHVLSRTLFLSLYAFPVSSFFVRLIPMQPTVRSTCSNAINPSVCARVFFLLSSSLSFS